MDAFLLDTDQRHDEITGQQSISDQRIQNQGGVTFQRFSTNPQELISRKGLITSPLLPTRLNLREPGASIHSNSNVVAPITPTSSTHTNVPANFSELKQQSRNGSTHSNIGRSNSHSAIHQLTISKQNSMQQKSDHLLGGSLFTRLMNGQTRTTLGLEQVIEQTDMEQ